MSVRMLAILNQKGGVGKTTTCVNLGAALARRGKRVLIIDMDPQANLTVHLGIAPAGIEATSYSVLLGQHSIEDAARPTSTPGLSVVPSTLALANAEIQLASAVGRELILKEALEEWLWPSASIGRRADDASDTRADFVLIDCPPSLGILSMNALCAAREVLLPIQTHFFALQGVAGILEGLKAVRRLNRRLELGLVLPSMVDRRTTLAREVMEEIRAYFGDSMARTSIGMNVKLAEAPSHGQTIFEYAPGCTGARDYDSLAGEILGEAAAPVPGASPSSDETATPEETGTVEATQAPADVDVDGVESAKSVETVNRIEAVNRIEDVGRIEDVPPAASPSTTDVVEAPGESGDSGTSAHGHESSSVFTTDTPPPGDRLESNGHTRSASL